jgi:hypothetical protein
MRARALALVVLALLVSMTDGQAQEAVERNAVQGLVEGHFRATRLADATAWMAGGALGLRLTEGLLVAGEASTLIEDIALTNDGAPIHLGFGYGGVAFQYLFGSSDARVLGLGLFAGAGRAQTREGVSGAVLGVENVILLRPEILAVRSLYRSLSVGVALGYRWAWGLDDLSGLTNADLRAVSASVSLRALRRE